MALTVELLKQLIASLPRSEDTEAALNFLKQSDLTQVVPAGERSSYAPAEYWLRIHTGDGGKQCLHPVALAHPEPQITAQGPSDHVHRSGTPPVHVLRDETVHTAGLSRVAGSARGVCKVIFRA